MRKKWLWALVVLVCFGVFFVFPGSGRAPSFADGIRALKGMRPTLDKTEDFATRGDDFWKYRSLEFRIDEPFKAVDGRIGAELRGRKNPVVLDFSVGDSLYTYYGFGTSSEGNASVTVQGIKGGKTTTVTVREVLEANLFDRVAHWWDGLTRRKSETPLTVR
jgi:hypothetical protein